MSSRRSEAAPTTRTSAGARSTSRCSPTAAACPPGRPPTARSTRSRAAADLAVYAGRASLAGARSANALRASVPPTPITTSAFRPWSAPTHGSSAPQAPSASCTTVTPRKSAAWPRKRRASAAASTPSSATRTTTEPTVSCASKLVAPNAPAPARKNCAAMSAMANDWRPRWIATGTGRSATGAPRGAAAGAPPREAEEQEDPEERERAGPAVGERAERREHEDDGHDGEDGGGGPRPRRGAAAPRACGRSRGAGQVGEQRLELAERAGGVARAEALLELVGVEPAVEVVAAQGGGDALAVGVRRAEGGGGSGGARCDSHAMNLSTIEPFIKWPINGLHSEPPCRPRSHRARPSTRPPPTSSPASDARRRPASPSACARSACARSTSPS